MRDVGSQSRLPSGFAAPRLPRRSAFILPTP